MVLYLINQHLLWHPINDFEFGMSLINLVDPKHVDDREKLEVMHNILMKTYYS